MIWAKRKFEGVDYKPYMDRIGQLQLNSGQRYREFLMVTVREPGKAAQDCYIGIPDKMLMALFDGFEPMAEADLPKVVDSLLVGADGEVSRYFQFRHDLPR